MLLKALDPTSVSRHQHLHSFLSQHQNTAEQLGSYPGTEFKVLRGIGSGGEGLVLECRVPQNSNSVAL